MDRYEEAKQAKVRIEAVKSRRPEMAQKINDALAIASSEYEPIDTGDEQLNADILIVHEYWRDCRLYLSR